MSDSKENDAVKRPFPKPPNMNNRAEAPPPVGLNGQATGLPPEETYIAAAHPKGSERLTDEETLFILRKYLRADQLADIRIIKFVMAYLENRNASQAAREAGLDPKRGSYLRSRPEIHAAVEAITAKSVMKYGYDASEVIERVKEIAVLDLAEFENPDGSFKTHLTQIKPEARRAIKKFKAKNLYGEDANGMRIVIGQLIEVELWDKLKSLELLGREKNIMKETKKVEHDITAGMADVLLASARRADERALVLARDVKQIEGGIYEGQSDGGDGDQTRRDRGDVLVAERSDGEARNPAE